MPIIESKEAIGGQEVTIFIETDEVPTSRSPYDQTRGIATNIVSEVKDAFGDGLSLTKSCAAKVVDAINAMDDAFRPAEFTVQLAIKLASQVGALLSKASAGAQLQVTMKWVHPK